MDNCMASSVRSAVKVATGQQNDFEMSLGKIGKEKPTQLIECYFADYSRC